MRERRSQRIDSQDNEQDGIGERPQAACTRRQPMSEQNVRHCRDEKATSAVARGLPSDCGPG